VVGGRSQEQFKALEAKLQAKKSNNCDPRAHLVRQAHRFDHEGGVAGTRTQRNKQDLVFLVVQKVMEFRLEFRQAQFVQRALENRVLQPDAESLQGSGHPPQPSGLTYVVADQVANAAHRVTNP